MTFIVERSPKGGKMLGSYLRTLFSHNLRFEPDRKPTEVGDYLAWKIGWSSEDLKRGDPIYIRKSDARHLYKILEQYI
jgi:hypothetical protein